MSEYEYKEVEFPIDDKLVEAVKQLEAEGWRQNPFKAPPKASYSLMREKTTGGAIGRLQIDDSLIQVLPAKGRVQ